MLAAITAVADCAWSSCNACSPDVQYKVLDTSTPAVAPLAHNVILLTMVHLVCSNAGSFATLLHFLAVLVDKPQATSYNG
jgi:hypothetical protein